MKPILYIMAAGMGSRYGGLKQMEALGPGGETLMDYSVYDAIRAGFGRVVFVIGKHFEDDFRARVLSKYENRIATDVVFQSLDDLPPGFTPPADRTKPWGTAHAVLAGRDVVDGPFLVINADDFYGFDMFRLAAGFLTGAPKDGEYCMVGYRLADTLSESGSVSRGVCKVGADGYLENITEHKEVVCDNGVIKSIHPDGAVEVLAPDAPSSQNAWGFMPDFIDKAGKYFAEKFLPENIDVPKSEFYVPTLVGTLVETGAARVKCLRTDAEWFGVTNPGDRPKVVKRLAELADEGAYPQKLFD